MAAEALADATLLEGVRGGDRRALAKAITLVESTLPGDRVRADALLETLIARSGGALRVGISGSPGVGKSTFIEALGLALIAAGHRVAVLAVDPSSGVSGGSILGDKTRMEKLSMHPAAFIRPTPSSGTLGGVAGRTREAILLCEAAGYDVVIVETVGVGQSETAVAGMTDLFALLLLPNAGDDLQAMKKGIMEIADLYIVNKVDLDANAAARAALQVGAAAHGAPVLQVSALHGSGIGDVWARLTQLASARRASGEFERRRRAQNLTWTWQLIESSLLGDFRAAAAVQAALPATLEAVAAAQLAPSIAARRLLDLFERADTGRTRN